MRQLEDPVIQFGFDDGQGILKLMEIAKGGDFKEDEERKRSKYSDGVCSRSSKLSSVKKLFIIGLVPNVSELYYNILTLLHDRNCWKDTDWNGMQRIQHQNGRRKVSK